jgi:hypothetical protein
MKITTAKWRPGLGNKMANPWFDMVNLAHVCGDAERHDQKGRSFPFTSLPAEILYYLAKKLPKESAVALALVNRAMYSLIGPRFFQGLSPKEHWRLLLLLERDSDLTVACQLCQKLHSPFVAMSSTRFLEHRAVRDIACAKKPGSWVAHGIMPAYCRFLAQRYLRHQPYFELLTSAARTKTYALSSDFQLFHTTTIRFIDGNLLVRQETLVAPLTAGGDLTSRAAYLLDDIGNGNHALPLCPHVDWQDLGFALSHDRAPNRRWFDSWRSHEAFYADVRYAANHEAEAEEHNMFPCSGRDHSKGCYDSTPIPSGVLDEALGPGLKCALLHHQPCDKADCNNLPNRNRVNLVRGCEICATDVCLSAQDIEGVGRVLGMTTWKHLGGIQEDKWAAWYAHHSNPREFSDLYNVSSSKTRAKMMRDLRDGTAVYTAFENIEPLPSGVMPAYWYTPDVSRRVRAHFTGGPRIPDSDWASFAPIFATRSFWD